MDILKKMFGKGDGKSEPAQGFKDEFRKPTWFEESETDDELFDRKSKFMFQMLTNPLELQKHFEQQMQELAKTMKEYEESGDFDKHLREQCMKPGFEENFAKDAVEKAKSIDKDLDEQIHAGQLHTLLQYVAPAMSLLPENAKRPAIRPKAKLSDEETIMGRIHGSIVDQQQQPPARRRDKFIQKMPPQYGGVFDGTYQGPKMFGQSIITQTIRKPDGTFETKRIVRDADGTQKTTITRSVGGNVETVTTYSDDKDKQLDKSRLRDLIPSLTNDETTFGSVLRNLFVSKEGYALPRNLW